MALGSGLGHRWLSRALEAIGGGLGTGSSLFEINIWMWKYGRTFPSEFSVEEAVDMRKRQAQDSRARAA